MPGSAANPTTPAGRLSPEPLPDNIPSIQPGGGTCYRLELAWGRLRRWYLKRFRPGYVRRMAQRRRGSPAGCPHEVLDPRDVKFFVNRCDAHWDPADNPFAWRDRLPVARWGRGELVMLGTPLAVVTFILAWNYWYLAVATGIILLWLGWFFRDPPRKVPAAPGQVVSPADGKVVEITSLDHDDFLEGPAVRIGIFLSIFNVHINRAPMAGRAIRLRYHPGQFLNALRPESAQCNENLWIGFQADEPPYPRLAVRQISGAIARRIVCELRPGQPVTRGAKFGMIKFGSRTELILPRSADLKIDAVLGQRVRAGSDVLAHWEKVSEE